ncbi:bifunctional diaminohydroxyphosphoribosylaminopyrimidine deaminase/5-amino-6-(5-phosphoribosylamino)uracil reductase RibD [Colwellia sp. 6M3]|jgi:diaminohydroxyphosphoribosylaminopyrimidine deaminase/5-amino-6-(5-phosphoribosylamino)uracil reductase|uniref:bifunctional diaminohydroxyphosphoribosylaminopyrimidine deaminase/5-amino-6-(5-phosphoribosylamino)uracil reductase RibD n=1 Tax=Colwellia sp. 6M3 TaxID=2759849 RepID=UPI00217529CD|nr:bifunctional diaminohydroxyphosphoribosylaminopyrimidine deaminase/5-amino-6-(5-phosphoribosylamino)uracil reductase RibD [Colwellia sp. 6M3]|tara:strand:- start:8275 stop:9411 length:1137 start_codon:yes stop_codon:yes gene_type:complete
MKTFSLQDHQFMQRAIHLAKRGHYTTSPNPRVGCVIVLNGEVIGEGFHQKAGQGHAEVHALKQAGAKAKGATAYVTLEPCSHFGLTPPCAEALIKAQVGHVIAAMVDPDPRVSGRGLERLKSAGITTKFGLLEQDARALNLGFITLMTTKLPYVRCKLAASLDGKTAMASGESQWITSPEAREDVQRLRAQSCGIICGADSVICDDAQMTVRWNSLGELKDSYAEADVRQPVRIIIDGKNRLTPDLAMFKTSGKILLIRSSIENSQTWPHFVEQVAISQAKDSEYIDLKQLLSYLAQQGLNDVLIESGAKLAGAFMSKDLVNELILYQAPKLIGSDGKSLVNMPALLQLSDAKNLNINDVTLVGKDIRITAQFTDKSV